MDGCKKRSSRTAAKNGTAGCQKGALLQPAALRASVRPSSASPRLTPQSFPLGAFAMLSPPKI